MSFHVGAPEEDGWFLFEFEPTHGGWRSWSMGRVDTYFDDENLPRRILSVGGGGDHLHSNYSSQGYIIGHVPLAEIAANTVARRQALDLITKAWGLDIQMTESENDWGYEAAVHYTEKARKLIQEYGLDDLAPHVPERTTQKFLEDGPLVLGVLRVRMARRANVDVLLLFIAGRLESHIELGGAGPSYMLPPGIKKGATLDELVKWLRDTSMFPSPDWRPVAKIGKRWVSKASKKSILKEMGIGS